MSQQLSFRLRELGRARQSPDYANPLHLPPSSNRASQGGWVSTAPVHEPELDGPVSTRTTARAGVGIFSRDLFLALLEREKRRTDRSKASLSIATFHLAKEAKGDEVDQFVLFLCESKRETDVVGLLSDEVLGVLLPDTGSEGSHRFVRKITDGMPGIRFAASVETYPEQVFRHMSGEHGEYRSLVDASESAPKPRRAAFALKRAIDLAGAAAGLTALFPIMLVVAVAIAFDSRGPIVYKQIRLGRRGRPFVFYKFRSMYPDADESIHRIYVRGIIQSGRRSCADRNESKPWSKLESDSRVTPVGRFIRKTCLDELPQLVNVLKGDLSLVGPRPPLPYEASVYDSWHLRRLLDVKPGVTGLWQVEGRNRATFDDMVRMDLRYVRQWSIALDLKILLRTLLIVVNKRGGG
jgi:lipopolysaccharide/colanic/teichoic acid biosynthesis glycosyltransferase